MAHRAASLFLVLDHLFGQLTCAVCKKPANPNVRAQIRRRHEKEPCLQLLDTYVVKTSAFNMPR